MSATATAPVKVSQTTALGKVTPDFESEVTQLRALYNADFARRVELYYQVGERAGRILGFTRDADGNLAVDQKAAMAKYGAQTIQSIAEAIGDVNAASLQKMVLCFRRLTPQQMKQIASRTVGPNSDRLMVPWRRLVGIVSVPDDTKRINLLQQALTSDSITPVKLDRLIESAQGNRRGRTRGAYTPKTPGQAFSRFEKTIERALTQLNLVQDGAKLLKKAEDEREKSDGEDAGNELLKDLRALAKKLESAISQLESALK